MFMFNALIIDPKDNVAVAIEPIRAGEEVTWRMGDESRCLVAAEDIPIYHKIAVTGIPAGAPVIKYGEYIGLAAEAILPGGYVHVHNVESVRQETEA